MAKEAIEFLTKLNEHLFLRQYIVPHAIGYAEVFLLCMLKLGELDISEPD